MLIFNLFILSHLGTWYTLYPYNLLPTIGNKLRMFYFPFWYYARRQRCPVVVGTNRKCASVVRRLFSYISPYAPEHSTHTHTHTPCTYLTAVSPYAYTYYIYNIPTTLPYQPFRLLRLNRPTRRDGRRIKHDLKAKEFTLFNVYEKSALVPRGFHKIIICFI